MAFQDRAAVASILAARAKREQGIEDVRRRLASDNRFHEHTAWMVLAESSPLRVTATSKTFVTAAEFGRFLRRGNGDVSTTDVHFVIRRYDKRRCGQVTYDEFLNGIRPRTAWVALETCEHAPSTSIDVTQHTSRLLRALFIEEIKAERDWQQLCHRLRCDLVDAFNRFDVDGNGFVCRRDLSLVLARHGVIMGPSAVTSLFRVMGADDHDRVSLSAWMDAFMPVSSTMAEPGGDDVPGPDVADAIAVIDRIWNAYYQQDDRQQDSISNYEDARPLPVLEDLNSSLDRQIDDDWAGDVADDKERCVMPKAVDDHVAAQDVGTVHEEKNKVEPVSSPVVAVYARSIASPSIVIRIESSYVDACIHDGSTRVGSPHWSPIAQRPEPAFDLNATPSVAAEATSYTLNDLRPSDPIQHIHQDRATQCDQVVDESLRRGHAEPDQRRPCPVQNDMPPTHQPDVPITTTTVVSSAPRDAIVHPTPSPAGWREHQPGERQHISEDGRSHGRDALKALFRSQIDLARRRNDLLVGLSREPGFSHEAVFSLLHGGTPAVTASSIATFINANGISVTDGQAGLLMERVSTRDIRTLTLDSLRRGLSPVPATSPEARSFAGMPLNARALAVILYNLIAIEIELEEAKAALLRRANDVSFYDLYDMVQDQGRIRAQQLSSFCGADVSPPSPDELDLLLWFYDLGEQPPKGEIRFADFLAGLMPRPLLT